MSRTISAVACAAFVIAAAGSAAAQSAAAQGGKFIHPADTNHDQKISRAEWKAFKGLDPAQFDKADANHDGAVDGPEFVAWDNAGRGAKPAG